MTVNCERRISTNSAPQALMLMNSDFVLTQAGHFAQRVRKEAPEGLEKQVALAWRIAYGRPAAAEEAAAALRFVQKQGEQQRAAVGPEKAETAALTNLCQQLLSSNEFLYVD
jgi:phage terminase large subunit-like protein